MKIDKSRLGLGLGGTSFFIESLQVDTKGTISQSANTDQQTGGGTLRIGSCLEESPVH